MASKTIAVIAGDGVGPEVCTQAVEVLQVMAQKYGIDLNLQEGLVGGIAYDKTGNPLPPETLEMCKAADAVLLGAVGGPQWEALPYEVRPERALLGLREQLGLFANLRPAVIYGDLAQASSLKSEVVSGTDIMVVRELTGGIYFGQPKGVRVEEDGKRVGFNTMIYHEDEIRRIIKKAFGIAQSRGKKLCSVDKANVLEVTELWRSIAEEEAGNYPDVALSHLYVDNAVMQLIRAPKQFDVIVTTNMFGDILSDGAAMLTGSIGMLPSASIGGVDGREHGMYEPVHGSAPDIAGKDICNPLATILSVGMIFKYSFGIDEANALIQDAVVEVIKERRTQDILVPGKTLVGCQEMGQGVVQQLTA